MFETGVRQLRMARALIFGRPINPGVVERLVGDALHTLAEFGSPGDDVQQLLAGPFGDAGLRRDLQDRALRRTTRRLVRVSPYYRELLGADIGPKGVGLTELLELPTTTKSDLIHRAGDFVADGSRPVLATRTTGTTGQPVQIWMSDYEVRLWPALAALSGVLRGEIGPQDTMQISISSRATAAVQLTVAVCRLVGARCSVLGIVPPREAVAALVRDRATLVSTYPSYLAELVKAARDLGVGPEDLHLRRIDCGGEVLSQGLRSATMETLGAPVNDSFGMTEVLPVSGRTCTHGHLHHDLNAGLVEVLDLQTGRPVGVGELGTVTITPYYPYRECMPVLRYNTGDLVRPLADGDLACELAGTPATSAVLGKEGDLVAAGGRIVTPREIVEAVESLPGEPWPARYRVDSSARPPALRLSDSTVVSSDGIPAQAVAERHLARAGIHVSVVIDEHAGRRVRADLHETTFAAGEAARPITKDRP